MNDPSFILSFSKPLDVSSETEPLFSNSAKNYTSTDYKQIAKQILSHHKFMEFCTEDQKKQILKNIKIQQYYPNQTISGQYEQCDYIQLVLEGTIKTCTYSLEGKQLINRFIPVGLLTNIVPLVTHQKFQRHQIAHEFTTIAKISGQVFLSILKENVQLLYYIFEHVCNRSLTLYDDHLYQNTQSLRVQLARQLVELAYFFSLQLDDGIKLQIRLSQENFADLLQTTRQRINKEFLWLEQEKIAVAKYNQIHILDLDRLKMLINIKA
ncbi:Crp/Fnr family transcriptional regulator [Acinetobacter populi]|nr:Crp/Fnr family transcriptional regulator [Acinetobacter populi]